MIEVGLYLTPTSNQFFKVKQMRRFGLFLAWIGVILILLFVLSIKTQTPNYNFFIYGLGGIFFGTILSVRKKKKSLQKTEKNLKNKHQNSSYNSEDQNDPKTSQNIEPKNEKTTRRKHF
jgi:predicted tellurium resistance membrane protein TerC